MTGWLRYLDPFTSASGREAIGVFPSRELAMAIAGNGDAVPYEPIQAHCRLKSKGGVYFTRQDISFGELFGALVEAGVVKV